MRRLHYATAEARGSRITAVARVDDAGEALKVMVDS